MKVPLAALLAVLVFADICVAQAPAPSKPGSTPAPGAVAPDDYSGMYSFVKEGEFMQVTIEEKGKVSGFVSRYGDTASDKDTFIDQFFKSGQSNGKELSFTTESVHGVVFTFQGTFDRGPGKAPSSEGYYILHGTLTRVGKDPDGKETTQARQVEFKSFPRDTQ